MINHIGRNATSSFLILHIFLTAAQDQQGADIRARSAAIHYRDATSIDDYMDRCAQMRRILPEVDQFYRTAELTIHRLRNRHPEDPQWVKLGDTIAALNAKDIAGVSLLKREMNLSLNMERLLPSKRRFFFDQRIRPLQKQEDVISEEEIKIAVTARNQGVALPEDVGKAIASRR